MKTREHLSHQEQFIHDVIRDHLRKGKPLDVDEIMPVIISRASRESLPMDSDRIKQIVKSFIDKKMILEGSTLTKEDVLNNEMRKKIHDFIRENSAVYCHQIMKELGLSSHSVTWHLNILFSFGFMKRIQIKEHYDHYIYHDNTLTGQQVKIIYFNNNQKCKEIIEYLRTKNEGCSKTHLSRHLSMHPNTIKKYLNALKAIGVVHEKRRSNKGKYSLTEEYCKKKILTTQMR